MISFIFLTLKNTHMHHKCQICNRLKLDVVTHEQTTNKISKQTKTHAVSLEKGEQSGLFHVEYDSFLVIQK